MADTVRGRTPRFAVVGGGIAGLAAAHHLVEIAQTEQRAIELMLFEARPRLGGSIATERTDGFVIEAGPDSFLSEKPWALALCERIGASARLVGTREEYRRTYVVHGGKLHPLPDGFLLLAPTRFLPLVTSRLFSWPGKLRMGLDLVLPRGPEVPDESLGSFVTRRLGREALERVAQPLVGGIYSADPDSLSLAATMPRFLAMEREHRSVILAMWRARRRMAAGARSTSGARWSLFVSFDDGMQSLVDLLAARLPQGTVRTETPVRSLERDRESGWRLNGEVGCDAVVLAGAAHASAGLLDPVDAQLATELRAIEYASSATVTLVYREQDVPRELDGFGFVVPLIEKRSIVACTFSSLKYPGRAPAGYLLMRAFVGGATQQHLFEQDDETMDAAVRGEVKALLGVTTRPVLLRIHRHAQAMPQYHVGHLDRLRRIDGRVSQLPGLAVAGNAYRGVGIPDCVHTGEMAARAVFEFVRGKVDGCG
jgi:protoporphyrinogen/coproporphyrinogen III oxidase